MIKSILNANTGLRMRGFMLWLLTSVLVSLLMNSCSTNKKISYKEDEEDIVNPERGFYIPIGTRASHFIALDSARLRAFRELPQRNGKAKYAVRVSLLYRSYELDIFKDKPLSDEFLLSVQRDFNTVRSAGLKIVLRFAYTEKANSGDCPDQYKICPPYGDAPPDIVFKHIEQLKPLLHQNKDVIAVVQEGFIGIWGENYFTDYFGDASTNGIGRIMDSSWLLRNELLKRLLDAVPKERMIQVRTPQIKQKYVYGPGADVNSAAIGTAEAFSGQDKSRIGFHNDCFLSSPDDYSTFYDYGSSSQPRQPANEVLRKYQEEDSRFAAVGGETCDDTFSPQNDCEPAGHAETEMNNMHYSFLNASYNTEVNNDWDSAGCMKSIKKKLGYRLILQQAIIPKRIKQDGSLRISFQIRNDGYASPYNPRVVELILRNLSTRTEKRIPLRFDLRLLFTGVHNITENVDIPKDLPQGKYSLYLAMPDADASIRNRPEYAIRLADQQTWEEYTGFNSLQDTIFVEPNSTR
jgi:Domain of unknown function (DUF4832)/Domain of unknown function (DUF4874)